MRCTRMALVEPGMPGGEPDQGGDLMPAHAGVEGESLFGEKPETAVQFRAVEELDVLRLQEATHPYYSRHI